MKRVKSIVACIISVTPGIAFAADSATFDAVMRLTLYVSALVGLCYVGDGALKLRKLSENSGQVTGMIVVKSFLIGGALMAPLPLLDVMSRSTVVPEWPMQASTELDFEQYQFEVDDTANGFARFIPSSLSNNLRQIIIVVAVWQFIYGLILFRQAQGGQSSDKGYWPALTRIFFAPMLIHIDKTVCVFASTINISMVCSGG